MYALDIEFGKYGIDILVAMVLVYLVYSTIQEYFTARKHRKKLEEQYAKDELIEKELFDEWDEIDRDYHSMR